MLFKLLGSLAIMGGSTLIGYVLSKDCSRRPQELRTLQVLLQMLENEISFLSSLVTEAFKKLSENNKNPVTIFFKSTARKLEEDSSLSASSAWEIAINEEINKTALNKEDQAILISFGKMLGNSDIEGQIKNIRLTIEHLKLQEQKAEESKAKTEKMYKSLGILGGLALVVILI